MCDRDLPPRMAKSGRARGGLTACAASLMLGACAQTGMEESTGLFASLAPDAAQSSQSAATGQPADPVRATEYWGEQYAKNPRDLDAALGYAQNLTALGKKREALAVLQQAAIIHGSDKKLAREYGRLALDLDQISLAKKLLAIADDPVNPDWRVVLARGTAHAKEGSYREAITYFERARALQPNHPSVLNNLALAYTMAGDAEQGETLLRQARNTGGDVRVRQNLALVLGVQGKYDEATQIASHDLQPADAQANTALLRKMVRRDARPMSPAAPPSNAWAPAVAEAPAVRPQAASAPAPVSQGANVALRPSTMETGFGGPGAASSPKAFVSAN